jgi:hypothetical protein
MPPVGRQKGAREFSEPSRLISLLAGAAQECAAAVEQLAAADKLLQQKAGLLPGATSGATPAK